LLAFTYLHILTLTLFSQNTKNQKRKLTHKKRARDTFVKAYKIRNAYVHGNMEELAKRKLTVNVVAIEVQNYL